MSLNFINTLVKKRNPAEFLLIVGFGIIGISLTLGDRVAFLQSQLIATSGVLTVAAGTAAILYGYLQDVRRRSTHNERDISSQIRALENRIEVVRVSSPKMSGGLTDEERRLLTTEVKEGLSKLTAQEIAQLWKAEFQQKHLDEFGLKTILEMSTDLVSRLQEEIGSLGRRANVNLVIGILISALGLGVLTWFVIEATNDLSVGAQAVDVSLKFAIRLTLAAFIQVFAYFFLRLYRYGIFEIKYFQNEITGAQFRIMGLIAALQHKDVKALEKLFMELMQTERNFILKKGETTVALQRDTIEKDYESQITKLVEAVLARKAANAS